MNQHPNVAHIEFFREIQKTAVVRIYDDGEFITPLILRLEEMGKRRESLSTTLSTSKSRWRRFVLNFRFQRLAGKILKLKKQAVVVGIEQLETAIRTSRPVAVERFGREFRLAKPNEMHELLEAAKRAESAWFFIFKPNDLLANKNTYVACFM